MAVANKADKPSAAPTAGPLALDGNCDTDSTEWSPLGAREQIAVVTCHEERARGSDEATDVSYAPDMTAYLVRGPDKRHGTSRVLGVWMTQPEAGESFGVKAVLRAANGDATHVLIEHGKGGLDEIPYLEIEDYVPATDAFGTAHGGVDVGVEVGANGSGARLVVCRLAPGGTYDQDKACRDQQGAITETFTIGNGP